MSTWTLKDLIGDEQRKKNRKIQLGIMANSSGMKRHRTRPRDPVEIKVLLNIVKENVRRIEEQGVLQVDGRVWKFNF